MPRTLYSLYSYIFTTPLHNIFRSGLRRKYSTIPTLCTDALFPIEMPEETKRLIHASISHSAWSKHIAAINSLKEHERHCNKNYIWPLGISNIESYIAWAILTKKLKHTTVKAYISSIAFAHNLKGLDSSSCTGFTVNKMIKGAANTTFYKSLATKQRKVMTFPLLKILGHQLAKSLFTEDCKQTLWTLFTVAFFGSFRMGELLCSNEKKFIPQESLLWNDITLKNDTAILRIKIPKSKNLSGEIIDLFKTHKCCPVRSLNRLKKLKGNIPDSPVFIFDSGILLTPTRVNEYLRDLLKPVLGADYGEISGHSFRAAIPSALAGNSDIASEDDIKCWGRWSSSSYKLYTRLSAQQKRAIFSKIVSAL